MKAADLFVKALENEGVTHIFAVPGEENLDLVESIRTSNIELVVLRHEQGAGFMAATLGRLTGSAGVCMATLGPGATNLVTAGAYAQLGGMPMLMITGQKPIKEPHQGRFQIVDVVDMMRPLTKETRQIVHGHTIPSIIRESFRIAERERPGAVHIELPEDIAREEVSCPLYTKHEKFRPEGNMAAIHKAQAMIETAKKPLLLIGAGANRKGIRKSLQGFVEEFGIPFFTTQMGKGVIDERSPLALGTAALSEGDFVHLAIEQADLIINVGHDVVEKPPFIMQHDSKQQVIHVNYYASHTDEVYFPQLDVIGDIDLTIQRLHQALTKQSHWNFDDFISVRDAIRSHVSAQAKALGFPYHPAHLVKEIREAMPEDGVIALDNGMYKIWFARNYPAYQPNTVLLDNALATMGAGLPSAMAAKMVYPERMVMAVCGDGGFMMNSHEIEPAVRLGLHLIVLIIHDNGYGMIKWKQENMGFKDFGLDFKNPDFVQYADSYGAIGHRVSKIGELKAIVKHCQETKGVHIIDCPVDYSGNVDAFGANLRKEIKSFKNK